MALDLQLFARKLTWYCSEHEITNAELAERTGIPANRLQNFREAQSEPTGDEVLILSDFFLCDYRYFISNEIDPALARIEKLYRTHSRELNRTDKWAILEFHYLCQSEHYLQEQLDRSTLPSDRFAYVKYHNTYWDQADDAARTLRLHLKLKDNDVPQDVFRLFRRLGMHVFRRRLSNSAISGLFINDPAIGKCILVNYDEDLYRQRFSLAHEVGHAVLDYDEDYILSRRNSSDIKERRANRFASRFLIPPEYLKRLPDPTVWDAIRVLGVADRLCVNPEVLVYAARDARLITETDKNTLKTLRIQRNEKRDVEFTDVSARGRQIRRFLLENGLSDYYVGLCFDAYERGIITKGRLAELVLMDHDSVSRLAELYGRSLSNGN